MVTDASETHCGGFIKARGIHRTCTIPLPPTARGESSTFRELVAIREVLTLWGETFSGRRICLKTDSSGAFHILGGRPFLSGGSNKPVLNKIAQAIFRVLGLHAISLMVNWHSRESDDGKKADSLSKPDKEGEYGLSQQTFEVVNNWYATATGQDLEVDIFASVEAHQLPAFFSRHESHESCGNALVDPWRNHFYAHPPLVLVGEAFLLARASGCTGVFIIPKYEHTWWYQLFAWGRN